MSSAVLTVMGISEVVGKPPKLPPPCDLLMAVESDVTAMSAATVSSPRKVATTWTEAAVTVRSIRPGLTPVMEDSSAL